MKKEFEETMEEIEEVEAAEKESVFSKIKNSSKPKKIVKAILGAVLVAGAGVAGYTLGRKANEEDSTEVYYIESSEEI